MNCPFCYLYRLYVATAEGIKVMGAAIESLPYWQVVIFTLLWANIMMSVGLISTARRKVK